MQSGPVLLDSVNNQSRYTFRLIAPQHLNPTKTRKRQKLLIKSSLMLFCDSKEAPEYYLDTLGEFIFKTTLRTVVFLPLWKLVGLLLPPTVLSRSTLTHLISGLRKRNYTGVCGWSFSVGELCDMPFYLQNVGPLMTGQGLLVQGTIQ